PFFVWLLIIPEKVGELCSYFPEIYIMSVLKLDKFYTFDLI
ncbi:MAG: hypothetical protein ACJAXH_001545, partial [Colwellia sp.]